MANSKEPKSTELTESDTLPNSFSHGDVQATSTPVAKKPATLPYMKCNNNSNASSDTNSLITCDVSNLVKPGEEELSEDATEGSHELIKEEHSKTKPVVYSNPIVFTTSSSSTCSSYKDAHDVSPEPQVYNRDSDVSSEPQVYNRDSDVSSEPQGCNRDSDETTMSYYSATNCPTASTSNAGAEENTSSTKHISVPILGYEFMEQRARFTVFKMHVKRSKHDTWFIFRRYTDFHRLNEQLRPLFPHFRLSLPPKKWFGDNFDCDFLEDRILGLQAFVDNVIGHPDVVKSKPARDFFCLDEPPGPHESLEESRALCQSLEEEVYSLRMELQDRDSELSLLKDEVAIHRAEVDNLQKALRIERSLNSSTNGQERSPTQSETSLPETDQALKLVIQAQAQAAIEKLKDSNIQLENLALNKVRTELRPPDGAEALSS